MKVVEHRLHAALPGGKTSPVPFSPSPNVGKALTASYLVMHFTAGRSAESAARWLCNPQAKASAHLVIGKDGKIIQLVPFNKIAWHAGQSEWKEAPGGGGADKKLVGMNKYSIGIELDNAGRVVRQGGGAGKATGKGAGAWRSLGLGTSYADKDVLEAVHKHEKKASGWVLYPAVQLEKAREVAALLVSAYGLKDILGHEDIAPGRKSDPGPAFPMASFRSQLFGRAEDVAPVAEVRLTTAAVNLRSGPGTQFAPVIGKPLPKGTRVEVLAEDGVWRQVDVLDVVDGVNDLHGWVHGRYVG